MVSARNVANAHLMVDDHRFLIRDGNEILVLYAYRGYATKPYIATLKGPSGRNMLEDSPADHVHHHGVWWGHGDVNGVDFYLETPAPGRRLGRIEHTGFAQITDDRPHFGFEETLDWIDDTGSRLIREERHVAVDLSACPDLYTIDLHSTYTAERDLQFGTTKESVLPGIRMAEGLSGIAGGGVIVASHGGTGEPEVMAKPAEWYDYSGTRKTVYGRGDVTEGLAVFDYPHNPNHPNPVFARAYGPTSPFQGNYFTGEAGMKTGEAWRYRHRLVVHGGDSRQADIAGRYRDWCKEAT